MIRSFLAIELPRTILKRMEEVQRDLKLSHADVRWVNLQNVHLTLKFFGNIDESRTESIVKSIEEPVRTTSSFPLTVRGMGAFPNLKHPRVIWLGLVGQENILLSFQKKLETGLESVGFPPEERPFHPHLTLGRVKSNRGREELAQKMERYTGEELGEFQVKEVVFFKSDLRPSGPVYTPLKELKLGN